jgi:hypothetical protein
MVPYTDLEEKTVQNTINYANGTKRYIVPFSSTEQFLGGRLGGGGKTKKIFEPQ